MIPECEQKDCEPDQRVLLKSKDSTAVCLLVLCFYGVVLEPLVTSSAIAG